MMQSILLAGGAGGGLSLISALSGLGLTSGLQVCVDAGDFESYIGSGDSLLDRSGNNFYFVLSGLTGGNPTFSGPSGYPAAYFGFSSSQEFFDYNTTNEAVFNTIHQNGASFSLLAMVYPVSGNPDAICGDRGATGPGFDWKLAGDKAVFTVLVTGTAIFEQTGDAAVSANVWHLMGVSVSEAVGSGFFYLDGNYNQVGGSDTFNATYSGPSSSGAFNRLGIASNGGGQANVDVGWRQSCFALWNRPLTKANFDSIWNLMRSRFGL